MRANHKIKGSDLHLCPKIQPKFTLVLIGRTGSGKSYSLQAGAASQHGKAGVFYLPTITPAKISKVLQENCSTLLIFDDVRPKRGGKASFDILAKFDLVTLSCANESAAKQTFFRFAVRTFLEHNSIPEEQLDLMEWEMKACLKVAAKIQNQAAIDGDHDRFIRQEIVSYLQSAHTNQEFARAKMVGTQFTCSAINETHKGIQFGNYLFITSAHKARLLAYLRENTQVTVTSTKLHNTLSQMGVLELPAGVSASQSKIRLNRKEIKAIKINLEKILDVREQP